MEIENLISNFRIDGKYLSYTPVTIGHINDTYVVFTDANKYILQKINHHIFKNVPQLINNILLATKHIANKIDLNPNNELLREKLELIRSKDQNYFYQDAAGNYWRLYNYIEGTSYDKIDNPFKAEQAGQAFGMFQYLLADLPAFQLHDTIPDFHNMKTRYNAFLATVDKNPSGRAEEVKQQISFVKSHIDEMLAMQELIDAGKIPMRITHNDAKINNVLFDKNDTPVCIVDLDTVMPGSVLYDFGDAIRTAANTCAEDEADLSKVKMDIHIFESYIKGYLETTKSFLIPLEIENLALATKYITFIMGLRFLTDYIDGDKYYKVSFAKHNLQRTKVQFKLVESMDNQYSEMNYIISKYGQSK